MSPYKEEALRQTDITIAFLKSICMPFTFRQVKQVTLHRLEAECAATHGTRKDYIKEIIAAVKRLPNQR